MKSEKTQWSKTRGYPYFDDIRYIGRKLKLSACDVAVAYQLQSRMSENNDYAAWPGIKMLAGDTRFTERSVKRSLKRLGDLSIIKIRKRRTKRKMGSNNHNEYRFIFPWSEQVKDMIETGQTGHSVRAEVTNSPKAEVTDNQSRSDKYSEQRGQIIRAEVTQCHPNESRKEKGISQSISQATDDDRLPKGISGKTKGTSGQDKLIPKLSEDQLKKIYWGSIPKPNDLEAIIFPFKSETRYARLDKPLPEWFETQLVSFCKEFVTENWNKHSNTKPGSRFMRLVARAGRGGVLQYYGFDPQTPEQIEAEKAEEERGRLEAQQRQAAEKDILERAKNSPAILEWLNLNDLPLEYHSTGEILLESRGDMSFEDFEKDCKAKVAEHKQAEAEKAEAEAAAQHRDRTKVLKFVQKHKRVRDHFRKAGLLNGENLQDLCPDSPVIVDCLKHVYECQKRPFSGWYKQTVSDVLITIAGPDYDKDLDFEQTLAGIEPTQDPYASEAE